MNTQPRKELFAAEYMSGIQQDLQLSNRQVKNLAHDIRIATGSHTAVEKNMCSKLHENNYRVDDVFEAQELLYRRENKDTKVEENFEKLTCV